MLPDYNLEQLNNEELKSLRDEALELLDDILQEIFQRIGGNDPAMREQMQELYRELHNH